MKLITPSSSVLLAVVSVIQVVQGFNFNISTPTQCNQLTVQWDGGTGPFHFILVPTITVTNGKILNITIPSSVTGPPYSYSFQLNAPSGLKFLASMWDSTGWGAGGTTAELTVGSGSDSSCLAPNNLYDFFFSTSTTSPTQCSPMTINWDSNVSLPVNLYGMIPQGTSFPFTIPQSSSNTSINWTVDIAQGTQFLLLMSDSGPYVTGGSTPLMTVGGGNSGSGCLTSTSPHVGNGSATSGSGTSSGTGTSTSSSPSGSSSVNGVGGSSSGGSSGSSTDNGGGGGGSSSNIGPIVGGAVGGVVALALLGLLLFCCIRRRRRERSSDPLKSYGAASEKGKRHNGLDLLGRGNGHSSEEEDLALAAGAGAAGLAGISGSGRRTGQTEMHGGEYEPSPFRYPSPPDSPDDHRHLPLGGGVGAAVAAGATGRAPAGSFRGAGVGMEKSASSDRASGESGRTGTCTNTNTNTNTNTTPNMTTTGTRTTPPTTAGRTSEPNSDSVYGGGFVGGGLYPTTAQSDIATTGHVDRRSSIRKSGLPSGTSGVPIAPGLPTHNINIVNSGMTPNPTDHPMPESGGGPTFVQHEDAGEIVDLPPRYDQLRARNPDQA